MGVGWSVIFEELEAANGNKAKAVEKNENRLPKNYEAILEDADSISESDRNNKDKHYDLLCDGVFLDKGKKRYWIERETNKHCVMLLARDLSIDGVENERYWKWKQQPIERDVKVDVAELLGVSSLQVQGKMDTRKLSPSTSYEVFLAVFMKDSACGWEFPVTLKLLQQNIKKDGYKISFKEQERGKWIEIRVGEFTNSSDGEIEVSMSEYDSGKWKSGLIIKGVLIRSKK